VDDLKNKRAYKRFYFKVPIIIEYTDPQGKVVKTLSGVSHDISSEGIYVEVEQSFALGETVDVRFFLPKHPEEIRAAIKIVRIEAVSENRSGIGGIFTKILPQHKDEIKRFFERADINTLLELTISKLASDLHLTTGNPPVLRVNGELEPLVDFGTLSSSSIKELVFSIMSKNQIKMYEEFKELDFGLQYNTGKRFRVNLYQQRGFLSAALRLINSNVESIEELRISPVIRDFAGLKEGLILITGPTGSGKSTTIAAMVEIINKQRKGVIITLERPIEFLHFNNKCIIEQREVGIDTQSFSIALKNALRQDPNIIVVGELDDVETVKTAITASEAGFLVIASFHGSSVIQSIDRLISMFPESSRKFILGQLANCLKGVICQLLLPRLDRRGRVLVSEVAVVNEAIKKVIRNDELVQLATIIQTGAAYKMQTMQESIRRLGEEGVIDTQTAAFYLSSGLSKQGSGV